MKKLMLATVSAAALGLAGIAPGFAQAPANPNTTQTPPAATAPTTPGMQQQGAQTDQGMQSNQGTQAEQGTPDEQGMQGPQAEQSGQARLSHQQVKQLQQQLKSAGLYKGRVDGVMGRGTKEALRSFQQQNNLQATGTPDQQTLSALQNGTTESGGSATQPGAESQPQAGQLNGSGMNSGNNGAAQPEPNGTGPTTNTH